MICVACHHFEYLIIYEKSATCGGSIRKVMTSSDSSRRGLSNDMRHVPPFWIFNEIQKIGKWWRHRTKLGEGFRMICVTCRHFLYLMRYDKSATCGRSMRKVMTTSDSAHQGLSNGMIHVPSFFNIWWDTKNRRHPEVRCGKWWRHQTHLSEGSRMICVTCRHFEYLIRYEKSATSGGSIRKVMMSSDSTREGL